MAKHPEPGRVKTRLAARIGAERAARLARAFVLDLRDRLAGLDPDIEVWWAFSPPGAPFEALVGATRVFAQCDGDLGVRMLDALERVRGAADGAVAVIGADAPHLPLDAIHRCRDALQTDADVVLGPADDGGYYLLGMRRRIPALFEGMPWGTGGVLDETRARLRALALRFVELAPLADVDDLDGLLALARLLAARPGLLRHTEAELGDLAP